MLARALCGPDPSDSVRTVKIYTKTGDGGETGLFGGPRVRKSDPRVEAYGDVDELNAAIGAARALVEDPEIDGELARVQAELFCVGAELATPARREGALGHPARGPRLDRAARARDGRAGTRSCRALTRFVLPGGTRTAAALHLARTVCRRAERRAVSLAAEVEVDRRCSPT